MTETGPIAQQSVALCMIVKDEAETLERAIRSALPVVDEVVVGIDDRTADESEAIARQLARELAEEHDGFRFVVFPFAWTDDFSAARNEALERCRADWVLQLDGHELLSAASVESFRKMMDVLPPETEAVGFRLRLQPEDHSHVGIQLRLFRNDGRIRYDGAVHNELVVDKEKTIGLADVVIDHVRTHSNRDERTRARNEMVPRRMRERLAEDPTDTKALYYLGLHAHEAGEYAEATGYYERYLDVSVHPEERYKVLWHLGRCRYLLGEHDAAHEVFLRGTRERWDLAECYVSLGEMALAAEQYAEAEHWFKLACDRELPLSGIFFSEDFYTGLPYHKLCELYERAGEPYKAILAGERLLRFENVPQRFREQVESFMPRWADRIVEARAVPTPNTGRRNFLIVDATGQFTGALDRHMRERYNVERIDAFLPQYLKWADVVWFDWCDAHAVLASQVRWDARLVVCFRSYEFFTDAPAQVNWGNVDHLVFVAPHVRRLAEEKFGPFDGATVSTILDGVDLDRFAFRARSEASNGTPARIAWVGFLNHKKNVPLLVAAAARLRDYEFHVAGPFQDERLRLYVEHAIDALGLANLTLHGWVDDVPRFLDDKRFILSTSLWEGTQVAVMEGMASGLTPLIHAWRGADEVYDARWTWRTVDELEALLRSSSTDPAEARRFAETHFDIRKRLAAIDALLASPDDTPARDEAGIPEEVGVHQEVQA
jgi:glycosyltransferase involved in cell wall biosynthesis